MKKNALIVLAEGFEEIEAVTPVDLLRRAGVNVLIAGLSNIQINGARNISLRCETLLEEVKDKIFDMLIFPGGLKGAERLGSSTLVKDLIERHHKQGRWITAICASPAIVFYPLGILKGKKMTCYPDCKMNWGNEVTFKDEDVVVDGNIITSKGPGTAFPFSLKLIEVLCGEEIALKVKNATLY